MTILGSIWTSFCKRLRAIWERIKLQNLDVISQIWTDAYPPEDVKKHTLLEKILITFPLLARSVSLSNFVAVFRLGGKPAYLYIEIYVIIWLFILVTMLVLKDFLQLTVAIVAVIRLIDILSYHLCVILVDSQNPKWKLASVRRSFLLAMINLVEIVLAFAILYLVVGIVVENREGGKQISDVITAIYFSFVTMTTLGYGEYIPNDGKTRLIVIAHIFTTILFLFTFLPVFVSNMASLIGGREWKDPSKRK